MSLIDEIKKTSALPNFLWRAINSSPYDNVLRWASCGTCIMIDSELFLEVYFGRSTSPTVWGDESFLHRQLCRCGFKLVMSDVDMTPKTSYKKTECLKMYKNPWFKRGRRDLVGNIIRDMKQNAERAATLKHSQQAFEKLRAEKDAAKRAAQPSTSCTIDITKTGLTNASPCKKEGCTRGDDKFRHSVMKVKWSGRVEKAQGSHVLGNNYKASIQREINMNSVHETTLNDVTSGGMEPEADQSVTNIMVEEFETAMRQMWYSVYVPPVSLPHFYRPRWTENSETTPRKPPPRRLHFD